MRFFICSVFLAIVQIGIPQTPNSPIPVELIVGNNRFGLQFLMSKKIAQASKFNFLTVTSFMSDYKNTLDNLDLLHVSQLSFDLFKGISIATGLSVNSNSGLAPTFGLQYLLVSKKILLVISPSIDFTESRNLQCITVLEYKPALTKKINLYTRFQAMYAYDTKNEYHQRSYGQIRLGIGVSQFQFGLAANKDYYGQSLLVKNNFGLFVRLNFY